MHFVDNKEKKDGKKEGKKRHQSPARAGRPPERPIRKVPVRSPDGHLPCAGD